jgi:dienelactone hydrolase
MRTLLLLPLTLLSAVAMTVLSAVPLHAAVKSEAVEYQSDGTSCLGTLVYDDAWTTPHPGVLVTHDWMGNTERTALSAVKLAQLGYVAFCVDVYGKGVRPSSPDEAGKLAGQYKGNRPLMRARMKAGLDALLATKKVDAKRIGAIGYCFGGTCVLELARAGQPVAATVTFHGGLSTPTPEDAQNIVGKVLVLHGADDPYVKPDEVAAFEKEMKATKVDWQLISFGNAVHGFTHQGAGTDNSAGYAYNAAADQRSWKAMSALFAEVFGQP